MKWLGRFTVNSPALSLLILASLTLISALLLPRLEMELDFENYFPRNNTDLQFYKSYSAEFGDQDNTMMIALYREGGIFDLDFLLALDSLATSLKRLDDVRRVQAITNIRLPRKTAFGPILIPLVELESNIDLRRDSMRVASHPLIIERLISSDLTSTVLVVDLFENRSFTADKQLVYHLDSIISTFEFEETHILSRVDLEVRYSQESSNELIRLAIICLLIVIVLMALLYRSFLAVILSILVFVFSLVNLGGLIVLLDLKLDVMATMIPSIVLIVSISDAIHIFARYLPPDQPMDKRVYHIQEVVRANFITSFTTAIGFFTLWLSPVPMLAYFGLYVGFGVLCAYFVSVLLLIPCLFSLRSSAIKPSYLIMFRWDRTSQFLQRLRQHGRAIVICTSIVTGLAIAGVPFIDTDRTLTAPLATGGKVNQSFDFFQNHYNGGREYELAISTTGQARISDIAVLKQIDSLHKYLDATMIGGLVSPYSYYAFLHSYQRGGNLDYFRTPESQIEIDRFDKAAPQQLKQSFSNVIDSSQQNGAFRGKMPDIGNLSSARFIDDIEHWINNNIDTSVIQYRHTGSPLIMDKVNDLQIIAMAKGLLLAILVICGMMTILFRNLKIMLISLLVNLLPLIILAGAMGFFGIELRGGTSIVFTIAFVIAVDDSIHFMNNARARVISGMSASNAIESTIKTTGLPITITSGVIFCAFILLMSSSLGNVRYLGFLVAIASVAAWVTDLVITPTMLERVLEGKSLEKSTLKNGPV